MASNNNEKAIPIRDLNLWGDNGNIAVSIKKGYPRFTYFPRNNDSSSTMSFISAPMDLKTFGIIGTLIRTVANTKEDMKFSIKCYNRDRETNETILQSVLVIARRSENIIIGIKKELNGELHGCKILPSNWIKFDKNDSSINLSELINKTALEYAKIIDYAIEAHVKSNLLPNKTSAKSGTNHGTAGNSSTTPEETRGL